MQKINLHNITELDQEFDEAAVNFTEYHGQMEFSREAWEHSTFFPRKKGQEQVQSRIKGNLLRVFADKNMHYTSPFPDIKVVADGPDEISRESAGMREKILHATHRNNLMKLAQKHYAFDGTVFSAAVNETYFDLKERCVKTRRIDPRFCYWQFSDDNENRLVAFWIAYPMTADQIKKRYGFEPTTSSSEPEVFKKQTTNRIDGKDWFYVIKRLDEETRTVWVGDKFIERPHKHQIGTNPIDICFPFITGDYNRRGDFYLRELYELQAEFNETLRRRANIVRRLGNPAVWARGVVNKQLDEVKRALKGDGGFVGLKQQGELGVLSIPETKMIDNHLIDLFQQMKYLSGFGNASFGESVGANTSGDALSMYYEPTTKAVADQAIAWSAFYEGINAKILRLYDKFLRPNERKQLSGYMPRGTFMGMVDNQDGTQSANYSQGGFKVEFGRDDINGIYHSMAIPQPATPKDEIAYKRFILDAVNAGFLSRITGYEEIGVLNPEDELRLLEQEQSNPGLNPEGTAKLLAANNQGEQPVEGDIFDTDAAAVEPAEVASGGYA